MDPLHNLLQQQVKQYFNGDFKTPESWGEFLRAISDVYRDFEVQRDLAARSLLLGTDELQKANAELFRSRQMLQAVLDTIPVRVFWKDRNSVYLGCNLPLARDCGYAEPSQLIGKTDYETNSAALADAYRADDLQVMETGQAKLAYEEQQIAEDGQKRWLLTSKAPLYNEDGGVIGILGTYEDITARKLAEEKLIRREELFRSLIENASDVITVLNCEGVIRFQSPSSERMLGYAPGALTERSIFEFVHPEDVAWATEALERTLGANAPFTFEYRFKHRDGTWRNIESVSKYVPGETTEGHIIVNSRDITESLKLEEQFRQAQKMEAIGQLSGGVAHDFNNLLTIIQGNVAIIESSEATAQDIQESVAEIRRASERAANLTRQLLAFSRRQTMHPVALELNEVISNMARMLQRILSEDITMRIDYSAQSLVVWGDASMIEQILMNLVVNSRDAMPKGGRLTVETAGMEIDARKLAGLPQGRPGSFVCLSVTDTGSGIAPEVMPKIFEPFFTTKDVGKGTGLGLATVYGIVEQHQGWIDVQSEVGKGTTFRIYLPRVEKPPRPVSARPMLSSAKGGNETILVVEDEAPLRALVIRVLVRLGYHVLEASSGMAAMEVWKEKRDEINLLLTDLVMPDGMTGRDLAGRLHEDRPDLKVIYSSGYSTEVAGNDLLLEEGINFLPKPFGPLKLAEIVRTRLDTVPSDGN